jgi:hypothetical protein
MRSRFIICFCFFFIFVSFVFAHEHGVARLDISIEKSELEIDLDGALGNFLSFEHRAKTSEERKEWVEMNNKLKGNSVFVFDTDCKRTKFKSEYESEDEYGQHNDGNDDQETHSDLEAEFEYRCKTIPSKIVVNLFNIFPSLETLEVRVSSKKQKYFNLNKENNVIVIE